MFSVKRRNEQIIETDILIPKRHYQSVHFNAIIFKLAKFTTTTKMINIWHGRIRNLSVVIISFYHLPLFDAMFFSNQFEAMTDCLTV